MVVRKCREKKGGKIMPRYEVSYRRSPNSSVQKTTVTADTREDAKAKVRRQNSSAKELKVYEVKEK